jgi:hypothetical protein
MSYNVNIVNVSLDDMSSVIRNILAEELKKAGNYFKQETDVSNDLDENLTREQVSKMLKVSMTTLFNWNRDKILINHKIGRRVYYNKSYVLDKFKTLKAVS